MAHSTAAAIAFSFGFLPPVTEKLTCGNYGMWYAQVSSTLKGAQLARYIKPSTKPPSPFLEDGTSDDKKVDPVPNPEYVKWEAKDQQVLSYLFGSLSKEIFAQVSTCTTAAELWAAIQALQASQSRARVISTRMALATTTKGTSFVVDYFVKMKGLADEMAAAGRKMEDEELVSFILTGLGDDFDSIVSTVAARVKPISIAELYAQLISYEQRKEMHGGGSQSSVNVVTKGGHGGNNSKPNQSRGRGDGGRVGFHRGGGGRGNGGRGGDGRNFLSGVFCQLCGKEGHTVVRCFKRFNATFTGPPQKSASSATTAPYGVDAN